MASSAKRFLGIELGGVRRTAVVALDLFASEGKGFVAELLAPVSTYPDETADEALVRVAREVNPVAIGVDAPLSLPPCIGCALPCPTVAKCVVPAVVWMRAEARHLKFERGKLPTPYTQRPVDLLLRGRWQEDAPVAFPVDESFGSSRAPLAARMQYLRKHLAGPTLVEANPRLALASLARWYGIAPREVRLARDVETGLEIRLQLLESMGRPPLVEGAPLLFLYNADISSLAQDLSAFDAFLCAFMALLDDQELLEEPGIDPAWGDIARPRRLPLRTRSAEASW